ESYNANPASMAATLKSLGSETGAKRRIAVLGPMRELGPQADDLHASLAEHVLGARVDRLILVGGDMAPLPNSLGGKVQVDPVITVDEAGELLQSMLRAGDVVLVKASNSVGLARLVERMTGDSAKCSILSPSRPGSP